MTGRFQGAVTRLGQVCSARVFRIWCLAHQLDLLIQDLFEEILSDLFYEPLFLFISFLHSQLTLLNPMGAKSPTEFSTIWNSLCSAMNWLITNQAQVVLYTELKQYPSLPAVSWLIIA